MEKNFGIAHVIDYDKHRSGNLLGEFLRVISCDLKLADEERENLSPDWAALEIKRLAGSLGVEVVKKLNPILQDEFNGRVERYVSEIIDSRLKTAGTV